MSETQHDIDDDLLAKDPADLTPAERTQVLNAAARMDTPFGETLREWGYPIEEDAGRSGV